MVCVLQSHLFVIPQRNLFNLEKRPHRYTLAIKLTPGLEILTIILAYFQSMLADDRVNMYRIHNITNENLIQRSKIDLRNLPMTEMYCILPFRLVFFSVQKLKKKKSLTKALLQTLPLRGLVNEKMFSTILYRYFCGRYSKELHSQFPPVQTFIEPAKLRTLCQFIFISFIIHWQEGCSNQTASTPERFHHKIDS